MTATTFWKLETKTVGMDMWGMGEEIGEIQKQAGSTAECQKVQESEPPIISQSESTREL